jgi:hypothetical protein
MHLQQFAVYLLSGNDDDCQWVKVSQEVDSLNVADRLCELYSRSMPYGCFDVFPVQEGFSVVNHDAPYC